MSGQSLYLVQERGRPIYMGIGERGQFDNDRDSGEERPPKYLFLDKVVKIPNILPDTEPTRSHFNSKIFIELYEEHFVNKHHLKSSDIPPIKKSELLYQFEMPVDWIDGTKEFLAKTS